MSTWVVGDIHGCYDTFQKLLKNPEIKEDDTIILIGDIIDRGPDSYKMIQWAMENITPDGRYQMVLGNHEDNIIHDFERVIRYNVNHEFLDEINLSRLMCQYDFVSYMTDAEFYNIASIVPIVKFFKELPLWKEVVVETINGLQKYIIAHAWFSEKWRDLDLKDEKNLIQRDEVLWFRDINDWTAELGEIQFDGEGILIHGHTPTISISINHSTNRLNEIIKNGNTINIDCGCVFEEYGGNLAAIRLEDQRVIYARRLRKIKS